jgi:LmbE family N-acetylglucosaminyl deacetylase
MHYLATNPNHEVHILCLTQGEFGIMDPTWKGPRLARIRKAELRKAAKINGIPPSRVHFGDTVDGFYHFSRESIRELQTWIQQLRPEIIFAPEPYYAYYWHSDHISAGQTVYYVFMKDRQKSNPQLRALYFYTTLAANFSWPFNDPIPGQKSLFCHQSQWWLLKWLKFIYAIEKHNSHKKTLGPWKYIEKYRRVLVNCPSPKLPPVLKGLIWAISHTNIVNPPEKHFVLPDMQSEFGQRVAALRRKFGFK